MALQETDVESFNMGGEEAVATFQSPPPIKNLRHVAPSFRVFAGSNALESLPGQLDREGAKAVLLVCGKTLSRNETVMSDISAALGARLAGVFNEVQQKSPVNVVEALRDRILDVAADGIVVLGGGSAIVTSRAASVLAGERKSVSELATYRDDNGKAVNPRMHAAKIPQWIIPSTPTPAYAKTGSAILDVATGRRVAIYDPKVRAKGLFVTPDIASTAPASLFQSSALNAVAMAVEGLLASESDPFAEAILFKGLKDLIAYLPHVRDDSSDADLRVRIILAAMLAGRGSDHTGGGVLLALSHTVGPRCGQPNGVVEGVLLPHVLRFTCQAVPGRLSVIAEALGLPARTPVDEVCNAIVDFAGNLGLPPSLSELGVMRDDLDDFSVYAANDWANSPRLPRQGTAEDFNAILTAAW